MRGGLKGVSANEFWPRGWSFFCLWFPGTKWKKEWTVRLIKNYIYLRVHHVNKKLYIPILFTFVEPITWLTLEWQRKLEKKIQKQMSVRLGYYFYSLHSVQWYILIFIYSKKILLLEKYYFHNIFIIFIQQFRSDRLLLTINDK